jgi:hypothetical protein
MPFRVARALLEKAASGTQFTCFPSTKVQIMTRQSGCSLRRRHLRYSVYLLYYYKSTNTDAYRERFHFFCVRISVSAAAAEGGCVWGGCLPPPLRGEVSRSAPAPAASAGSAAHTHATPAPATPAPPLPPPPTPAALLPQAFSLLALLVHQYKY